jgi:hypothetical protein
MEALVRGKQASWVYDEIKMKSWAGCELCYKPLHLPGRLQTITRLLKRACRIS